MSDRPACMDWPRVEGVSMYEWQDGRCAMCAATRQALVMDHDHRTGLIRGLLCRPCNRREGIGDDEHWGLWREWINPALMLDVVEEYSGPFYSRALEIEMMRPATWEEKVRLIRAIGSIP